MAHSTPVDEVPNNAREVEHPVDGARQWIHFAPDTLTLQLYTQHSDGGRLTKETFRQLDKPTEDMDPRLQAHSTVF